MEIMTLWSCNMAHSCYLRKIFAVIINCGFSKLSNNTMIFFLKTHKKLLGNLRTLSKLYLCHWTRTLWTGLFIYAIGSLHKAVQFRGQRKPVQTGYTLALKPFRWRLLGHSEHSAAETSKMYSLVALWVTDLSGVTENKLINLIK